LEGDESLIWSLSRRRAGYVALRCEKEDVTSIRDRLQMRLYCSKFISVSLKFQAKNYVVAASFPRDHLQAAQRTRAVLRFAISIDGVAGASRSLGAAAPRRALLRLRVIVTRLLHPGQGRPVGFGGQCETIKRGLI
jgi:hypothetical protein